MQKEYKSYNLDINSQKFNETCESLEINLPEQFECLSETSKQPVTDVCVINSEKVVVSTVRNNEALELYFGETYIIDLNSRESIFPILNCGGVSKLSVNKYDPNLLILGGVLGTIDIWDIRYNSKVIGTDYDSMITHSSPIILAETIEENVLQTLDTFGNLAKWSMENLSKPVVYTLLGHSLQELLELKKENNISDITVATYDSEIICGTTSGQIVKVNDDVEVNQAHRSFITGVECNPSNIDLVVTSSIDCKMNFWDIKNFNLPLDSLSINFDYVKDVKWNPVFHNILGSITNRGKVCVWNFSKKWKCPIYSDDIGDVGYKIDWTKDGRVMIVVVGRIKMLNISKLIEEDSEGVFIKKLNIKRRRRYINAMLLGEGTEV